MTGRHRDVLPKVWRPGWVCVVLALTGVLRGEEPKSDPASEHVSRVATLYRRLAKSHFDIGNYCFDNRCFEFANLQYRRTLTLDPDHEFARKKLGFRKEEGKWVPDSKARVSKTNEAADYELVLKVEETVGKKLASLGKTASSDFAALAEWCGKAGLKAEAETHYGEALDYDVNCAKARKALGFARDGKSWALPAEKAAAEALARALKEAPVGDEASETSTVERAIGVKLTKRRSKHFFIQAPSPQEKLKLQIQVGEATVREIAATFGFSAEEWTKVAEWVFLASHEDHGRYIDAFMEGTREQKEYSKQNYAGSLCGGRHEWLCSGDDLTELDRIVHETAHDLCSSGGKPWLSEGLAYTFSARILGTARMRCAGNEVVGGSGNFGGRDTATWKSDVRKAVANGTDPEIGGVLGSSIDSITFDRIVKGWSLIDFLLAEPGRREKFHLFLQRLGAGLAQDRALGETFGWTPEQLDSEWKRFVRTHY